MKLSFCTACMGRKHHLEQLYEQNIQAARSYGNVEFVLLDYNSSDGLESWVRDKLSAWTGCGTLRYFRTTEPQTFHMAHAKNAAHRLATGEILINLDADNGFQRGFAEELHRIFSASPGVIARFRGYHRGCSGRIALRRDDFYALGGYDEDLQGWGYEDQDLVARAHKMGLRQSTLNSSHARAIQHNDNERLRMYDASVRRKNDGENRARSIMNLSRGSYVANKGKAWGLVGLEAS